RHNTFDRCQSTPRRAEGPVRHTNSSTPGVNYGSAALRHSASKCRRPCWLGPTRSSNEDAVHRAVLLGLIGSIVGWADRKGDQGLGGGGDLVRRRDEKPEPHY